MQPQVVKDVRAAEALVEECSRALRRCRRNRCKDGHATDCTNEAALAKAKQRYETCLEALRVFNEHQMRRNEFTQRKRLDREERRAEREKRKSRATKQIVTVKAIAPVNVQAPTKEIQKEGANREMTTPLTLDVSTHNRLVTEGKTAMQIGELFGMTAQQVYTQRTEWRKQGLEVTASKTGPQTVLPTAGEEPPVEEASVNAAAAEVATTEVEDKRDALLLKDAAERIERLIRENEELKGRLTSVNQVTAELKYKLEQQSKNNDQHATNSSDANAAAHIKALQVQIAELQKQLQEQSEAYELLELTNEGLEEEKEALEAALKEAEATKETEADWYKNRYEKLAPITKVLLQDFAEQL